VAAGGAGVARVHHEVDQHLLELAGVGGQGRQRGRRVDGDLWEIETAPL